MKPWEFDKMSMSDFRMMVEGKREAEKAKAETLKEILKPIMMLVRSTSTDIKNRWSKKNSATIKPEQLLPLWFDEPAKPSKPIDPVELEKDRKRIKKRYDERANKGKPSSRKT